MCGLSALLARMPAWAQRAACAVVPAAVAWLCLRLLSALAPFMEAGSEAKPLQAALAGALFGLALQHYFELRARAHSPALAEARLQALQARIRPHFLFNSLNAVLSLIRTEPKRAESTLEDLAELFRVFMRDTRDLTSLEKEIELCRQYLAVEKLRLGERLQVQWDTAGIDEEVLRRALVPSLLLQPLLENAVHYGVEPASTPALIRVDIKRTLERIEIAIFNPHHPDSPASGGNHMALNNVRQRLALLYDVEGQLSTAAAHGIFEVRLRIPYRKSK
jgi:two-component system sensor histidine kinase AlgZ